MVFDGWRIQMKAIILAITTMLLLSPMSGAQQSSEEVLKPSLVEIKAQTKFEKVKEWSKEAFHPVAVFCRPATFTIKKSYGSFHKHVLEPINVWGERHQGLISVGSAASNFGLNALIGATR